MKECFLSLKFVLYHKKHKNLKINKNNNKIKKSTKNQNQNKNYTNKNKRKTLVIFYKGSYYTIMHYWQLLVVFFIFIFSFTLNNIPTNKNNIINNTINWNQHSLIIISPFRLHNWVCSIVYLVFCVAVVSARVY